MLPGAFRLRLPHVAFNRRIGAFKDICATPEGELIDAAQFQANRDRYLPSADDGAFVQSLMMAERAPGKFAGWIAPPKIGIDGKPGDFHYVKIAA